LNLLKRDIEGKKNGRRDEEEEVNTYWMILGKREDAGNLRRNH
jgi:hypothetical protein